MKKVASIRLAAAILEAALFLLYVTWYDLTYLFSESEKSQKYFLYKSMGLFLRMMPILLMQVVLGVFYLHLVRGPMPPIVTSFRLY